MVSSESPLNNTVGGQRWRAMRRPRSPGPPFGLQIPDTPAAFLESCRGYSLFALAGGGRQLVCRYIADTRLSAGSPKIQVMPDFIGERGGTRTLDPMIKSPDAATSHNFTACHYFSSFQ